MIPFQVDGIMILEQSDLNINAELQIGKLFLWSQLQNDQFTSRYNFINGGFRNLSTFDETTIIQLPNIGTLKSEFHNRESTARNRVLFPILRKNR
jgi:hypothetical protein